MCSLILDFLLFRHLKFVLPKLYVLEGHKAALHNLNYALTDCGHLIVSELSLNPRKGNKVLYTSSRSVRSVEGGVESAHSQMQKSPSVATHSKMSTLYKKPVCIASYIPHLSM